MSELFSKFQIHASNTVVAKKGTVLQCYEVKICHSRANNSSVMTESKFCILYAHVLSMSELCCKFQIPALNSVRRVAETEHYYKVQRMEGRKYVRTFIKEKS